MLRYWGNIRTVCGRLVRLEIYNASFNGLAEELIISADTLEIDQTRDGRFGAICSAGWTILVESDANFKFQPMLLEGDLDNVCKLFEDNKLMFVGFLENGIAEEDYSAPPYDVQLAFNDGLKKLQGYYINPIGMWDKGYYNFIELLRICLSPIAQPNVQGKKMLYINNSLYNDAFKQDIEWSCYEQIYLHASSFDGDKILLYDLLSSLLKTFSCYITQEGGDWYIERVKNKIHTGSASYHAFELSNAYNIVNNRGWLCRKDNLIYQLGNNKNEFNDGALLSTEKEYGVMNIEVDTNVRSSIFSNRFSTAKSVSLVMNELKDFKDISIDRLGRSTYAWYYSQQIGSVRPIVYNSFSNKYGIKDGMEMTHSSVNAYIYHMFTQSPCHFNFGSKITLSYNVYVELKQDVIDKKTYVIIPFTLNNYAYVNTTDWPNGGKITCYVGYGDPQVIDVSSRWQNGTTTVHGMGYFIYNSDNDSNIFTKWYNGESIEVKVELHAPGTRDMVIGRERIYDMPYLMLWPPLFCDGDYAPTCDNSKITRSAYGDVNLLVNDPERLENGYVIDKTTTGEYISKREAPPLQLKFWEGPPIIERDISIVTETYKLYVNYSYKNLIYVPVFDETVTKDAVGNITGYKLIDGDTLNIKVSNTQNYTWYDRFKIVDEYNKKGFLLEHIAQDQFDSYYKPSRIFKGTLYTSIRPMMLHTYKLKHLPDTIFVATSIKQLVDSDEYEIVLAEVKDREIKTELILPRVKSKTVTN